MKKNFWKNITFYLFKWIYLCLLTIGIFSYSANSIADVSSKCPSNSNLTLNGSLNEAIDYSGDKDSYRITIPSDGNLTVYTTGSTDTFGSLRSSNCLVLQSNNNINGGRERNFSMTRNVTAGTYYLIVRHASTTKTGNYTLMNTFTPTTSSPSVDSVGNTCTSATSLSTNGSILSSIDPLGNIYFLGYLGDVDYFRIDLSTPSKLNVQTTGYTDTYGYLKDSNCNTISSDDDSGTVSNFLIEQSVAAGTYYVAVMGVFRKYPYPYLCAISWDSFCDYPYPIWNPDPCWNPVMGECVYPQLYTIVSTATPEVAP